MPLSPTLRPTLAELQAVARACTPDDRRYSQFEEDAVLHALVDALGITRGTFVEIGTGPGVENNTRRLAEDGWTGVWFEAGLITHRPPNTATVQGAMTPDNVVARLEYYVPSRPVDVFSLDIDGNDYWVGVPAIDYLQPTILVVEYNGTWQTGVMPYTPGYRWRPGLPFGASLAAWQDVLSPNYHFVYRNVPNAFFVRKSAVA